MTLAQTNVIDISKWQKASDLDWQGLVDNGVKAVIIQLSHGLEYEDQAKESIAKSKQYGLIWHGYHFYEGLSGEVAFSTSNAKSLGLPDNAYMFLDMEGSIGGDWQSQFYDFRTAWLSAGWRTGIYTSDSPYRAKFNNAKLVKDSVYRWIASYGKNNGSPDLAYEPADYDIWQYTSSGGIGQYESDLDHNYDKTGSLILTYEQNIKGSVGFSKDSIRGGGVGLGYSPDQKSFRVVLSPNGFEFNQDDGDRIWPFISGKIPKPTDVSNFITGDYVLNQLKSYAKLTDIPDVSKFLTESNLASYALKTDIPSLTGYAKLTDIPKVDLTPYLTTELAETTYATKDDLAKVDSGNVDLSAYAKTADVLQKNLISIEINPTGTFKTPFIDFHTKMGGTHDYDARIIVQGGSPDKLGVAVMNFIAGNLQFNGKPIATQEYVINNESHIIDTGNVNEQLSGDSRTTDNPPSWYLEHYPSRVVREFKNAAQFKLPLPTGQTSQYVILTTKMPGSDKGFGYGIQEAETTKSTRPLKFMRIGTSDTTWSAWELMTTW